MVLEAEIDIDFALHGVEPGAATAAGPASRWAARAAAGDRVVLLGPELSGQYDTWLHVDAAYGWRVPASPENPVARF